MTGEQKEAINRARHWEMDLRHREVRTDGIAIRLGSRAFDIMEVLVEAGGGLVTKNDLMERVWPGTFVGDNTLQVHVSAVRKALGGDRAVLKTVSGRGYRLLGDWTVRQDRGPPVPPNPPIRVAPEQFPSPPLGLSRPDLIGRATAVQHLLDLLSAYRIVTLIGPGGIGKTRLALEVAHSLPTGLERGCAVVELVSLADPDLVLATVADVLGVAQTADVLSLTGLARAIGDKPLLLVLDNCEHVIESVAQLAEAVVQGCPRTIILATSRELLRIDGECAYHVRPLDVPAAHLSTPDAILDHSAVQLFVARAKALGSGSTPQQDDLAKIVAICKRLDGIPLAIEFAAARAATLGLTEVLSRLDDRFALLTDGRRTALPRHRTLRATLDWSYELLPPTEQQFLRAVAVFSAGFTFDAAATVSQGRAGRQQSAVESLGSLVGKSLIQLDRPTSPTRWRLLETTRAYALEKLRDCGEFDAVSRRQAEYYVAVLSPVDAGRPRRLTPEQVDPYLPEIDNVRTALDWAFSPSGDAALGVSLTTAAIPLWHGLSYLVECRERVERVLDRLSPDPHITPRTRLELYAALGMSLINTTGMQHETRLVLNRARAIAADLDDVDRQLEALWALWTHCFNNGEALAAEAVTGEFLSLAPRATVPADRFVGERLMAVTMHYQGRQQDARDRLEHVLGHYVAPADRQHIARFYYDQKVLARAMLARVLWLQGFVNQALSQAQESVFEAEASGHTLSQCYALAEAACPVALMTGNLEVAARSVARLLDLARRHRLGFWSNWGRCLEGTLLIERGDPETGLPLMYAGLDAFRAGGWAMRFPVFLGTVANGLAKTGQAAQGLALIDEALARSERDGEMWCFAELLRNKAEVVLQGSSPAAFAIATDLLLRAIDVAREQGALFWELRAAISLARLAPRGVLAADTRNVLTTAHRRFVEGFGTADLAAARSLLAPDMTA